MRLWHKDLISYLPKQQLIAQWRECCAIASNLKNKGTPNHLLVNKVLSSRGDFYAYCGGVIGELEKRGYKVSFRTLNTCIDNILACNNFETNSTHFNIFPNWHNERYLKQCLFNLQEKYDCGGISEEEWKVIENDFNEYMEQ